ncbi:MAG: hypothetical protein IPL94_08895, partial [Tetrasphaera sp.]|nr:hypothetical protein [Tetrasphaera sp.]
MAWLLFLAYAGGRAGSAFIDALRTPLGWEAIVAGLLVSAVHGIALVVPAFGCPRQRSTHARRVHHGLTDPA